MPHVAWAGWARKRASMTMVPNSRPKPFCEESLIPEPILPSQFLDIWHRRSVLTPERELLLAVLIQARDDLRAFRSARTRRGRRLYTETYERVASDDRTWMYAFGNICDILSLSAECARAKLLREGAAPRPPERSSKVTKVAGPVATTVQSGGPSQAYREATEKYARQTGLTEELFTVAHLIESGH